MVSTMFVCCKSCLRTFYMSQKRFVQKKIAHEKLLSGHSQVCVSLHNASSHFTVCPMKIQSPPITKYQIDQTFKLLLTFNCLEGFCSLTVAYLNIFSRLLGHLTLCCVEISLDSIAFDSKESNIKKILIKFNSWNSIIQD